MGRDSEVDAETETETESKMAQGMRLKYDKVLVDAQCTLDGSVRHLQKYRDEWGWARLHSEVLNEGNAAKTVTLQHSLLRNGFALLRDGGVLVYSTCSLSARQNECVV